MILQVKNLNVSFSTLSVIKGVNFEITEGETLALVGESGSGKTMIALSIMRLLPEEARMESGEIMFEDRDLLKLSGSEMRQIRGAKISMIFQEPFTCLNPLMKVGYQIQEAISAHSRQRPTTNESRAKRSLPEGDQRQSVLNLLKDTHIKEPERIANSYSHQLSGGQRQRVMVAMALAMKPKILIADEPTTALDVTVQAGILSLLKELKTRYDMSMLFITHDLAVAGEISEKVLVMQKGKIVERGGIKDVFQNPKEPYTRELLDSVPRMR